MNNIIEFKSKAELMQEQVNQHWAELLKGASLEEYTDEETCNGMHQPIEE